MFLKQLRLQHYNLFEDAAFDLATDIDHPLVLITGNNGAGKTSMLEALRIALHGRRAFDVPLGEVEYLKLMAGRFKDGDFSTPCTVSLAFDYVDEHLTRSVVVHRSWALRRQHIAESLDVIVDGEALSADDAEDMLTTIVPPEIARYFFFDGERISELAEWGSEEETTLFQAVGDLLGLGVLEQLRTDLGRLIDQHSKTKRGADDLAHRLRQAESSVSEVARQLKAARAGLRRVRSAWERARTGVRRLGALQKDEISRAQEKLSSLQAERKNVHDEFFRVAHDILPLLFAKTLQRRFGKEFHARLKLEEREIVSKFLNDHASDIKALVRKEAAAKASAVIFERLKALANGKPMVVAPAFPHISRSDAAWMQRIIERELPELSERVRMMRKRLIGLEKEIDQTKQRVQSAPLGDPAAEAALAELEQCQRAMLEHDLLIGRLEQEHKDASAAFADLERTARLNRQEAFRAGRLSVRARVMQNVLAALPVLAKRLQESKEHRFAEYLKTTLCHLWHKPDRVSDVLVSFADRRIELLGSSGPIDKSELSAGEKQLFAIAFIYALAQLSGSRMPLVIDTPLGRLDHEHRRRFVGEFLPSASHQVIMLSTDTEIVGPLYQNIESLLAHHYELAIFNGGVTSAVQLASA